RRRSRPKGWQGGPPTTASTAPLRLQGRARAVAACFGSFGKNLSSRTIRLQNTTLGSIRNYSAKQGLRYGRLHCTPEPRGPQQGRTRLLRAARQPPRQAAQGTRRQSGPARGTPRSLAADHHLLRRRQTPDPGLGVAGDSTVVGG